MKKIIFMAAALFILIAGCSEPNIMEDQEKLSQEKASPAMNEGPLLSYDEFLKARGFVLEGDEYIYEGDISFSKKKVESLYEAYLDPAAKGNIAVDDSQSHWPWYVWNSYQQQNLTYQFTSNMAFGDCSDSQVRAAFKEAVASWSRLGNIKIWEVSSAPVFKVFPVFLNTTWTAASFFPNSNYAYELRINKKYQASFNTYEKLVGLFTHELGHSLGFAHEHQRYDSSNTYNQGKYGVSYNSFDWASVMHYGNSPYLSGASNGDRQLLQFLYGIMHDAAWNYDGFGNALAAGDFDGDGYEDAAIGVSGEFDFINQLHGAGAVHIVYGSTNNATENQLWSQDSPGIYGTNEEYDRFGSALAVGDFDGDGYDDLAVGAPWEDIGSVEDAGLVNVIYGSKTGLNEARNQGWTQDSSAIIDQCEKDDEFGYALAAGDFNHDGYDDLAIGVHWEDYGSIINSGAVHIIYGTSSGLASNKNQFWTQNTTNISDTCENNDAFGTSLTVGDFDRDGYDDLAIGAYGEGIGSGSDAGAVHIIYGTNSGLSSTGNQFWNQDTSGIADSCETSDHFGHALSSGDFDHDGYDDLAIGVYGEDYGSIRDSGMVHVIYGTYNGLSASGSQNFTQNTPNIEGSCEKDDYFGYSLASGDFDKDGFDDLAIGVKWEAIGSISSAGAVNVIYGASSGLTTSGDQFWNQDSSGVSGGCETGDTFGASLAALDLNNDGYADLAVGVPLEDLDSRTNCGSVNLLYGASSGITSSGNQRWDQNK